MTILFIGTRGALDRFMLERGINPSEHGKTVKWAKNGPNTLRGLEAPIEIVRDRTYTDLNAFEENAIVTAKALNAIAKQQGKI